MKSSSNFFFAVFFLFVSKSSHAQIVTVKHKYNYSVEQSYAQAEMKALEEAKKKALQKAGVKENIESHSILFRTEVNDDFSEIFRSDILSNLSGAVKNWKHLSEPQGGYDEVTKQYFVRINIEANIKKYKTKPDPAFKARIEGVEPIYSSEDYINFSITPFQDCYLKVFYITQREATICFPIEPVEGVNPIVTGQDKLLKKGKKKSFNYIMAYTEDEVESGSLIVVITKDQFPYDAAEKDSEGMYYTATKLNKVFEWMLGIEPSKRMTYYEPFSIKN